MQMNAYNDEKDSMEFESDEDFKSFDSDQKNFNKNQI